VSEYNKQYDTRDTEMLGEHYVRHLGAMTREKLETKAAIAAELAYRDWGMGVLVENIRALRHERDELAQELVLANADVKSMAEQIDADEDRLNKLIAEFDERGLEIAELQKDRERVEKIERQALLVRPFSHGRRWAVDNGGYVRPFGDSATWREAVDKAGEAQS
jgi:seryl-tRNA synthetase